MRRVRRPRIGRRRLRVLWFVAILGVTVTAVKLRAHRAYASLRRSVGEHLGGLEETVRS